MCCILTDLITQNLSLVVGAGFEPKIQSWYYLIAEWGRRHSKYQSSKDLEKRKSQPLDLGIIRQIIQSGLVLWKAAFQSGKWMVPFSLYPNATAPKQGAGVCFFLVIWRFVTTWLLSIINGRKLSPSSLYCLSDTGLMCCQLGCSWKRELLVSLIPLIPAIRFMEENNSLKHT